MARLTVRAQPGASRDAIALEGDVIRARLAAPAVDNKANDRLVTLVAKLLGVPRRDVTIRTGHAVRNKVLDVVGLTDDEVHARLTTG